jgi:hypothetical protein
MQLINSIDFLQQKKIISNLISHYSEIKFVKYNITEIRELVNKIINILRKNISESKHFESDLGNVYIKEISYTQRKLLGEIYTPKKIVSYILQKIGYNSYSDLQNKRLIDLSCGSGSFLEAACEKLIEFYKRKFEKINLKDFSPQQAKVVINQVRKNIFGIDVNPITCILCQINLHLKLVDLYRILYENRTNFKPPIFKIICQNAYHLKELISIFELNSFNFVVGNPPYVFIRDISEKHKGFIDSEDFKTKFGQYDSYQLFLELGIKFLQRNGVLGYIVPDSVLALSNRRIIRKYIYNSTKIKELCIVNSQFKNSIVSNIILILEKEKNKRKRENNIINVMNIANEAKLINNFPQKLIRKWNYKFLINLNSIDIKILEYLNQNFLKLKDLMEDNRFKILLNRGVELTKEGKVFFCSKCENFYPIPKRERKCQTCGERFSEENIETIIYDNLPPNNQAEYKLYLHSLNRYNIEKYKYINISKKGIDYKNLNYFKDRIIIRQMNQNNRICASFYEKLLLCSQSYYNLKVEYSSIQEFNNLYLLGLINSLLLSYFFIKSFGSYKQLFPRILIETIRNLPIKVPNTDKDKIIAEKIINRVKILLNLKNSSPELFHNEQNQIDSLVFKLYQLPSLDIKYIRDFMINL